MADVEDWGKFIRGRWDWNRFGYEAGFPRGCGFTDIDAAVEFDGHRLVIEPKHHDGDAVGFEYPKPGQLQFLRDEVRLGKAVIILYGCATCNDPWAVRVLGPNGRGQGPGHDRLEIWRGKTRSERRRLLKDEIDLALGLAGSGSAVAS